MKTSFINRALPALIASSVFASAACGGGGYKPPSPLSHRFPEEKLARIDMQERTDMQEQRNKYLIAKDEYTLAQTRHEEAATDVRVARNELKQAKLDQESAAVRKKDADASGDLTRINTRKRELREAELKRKAADLKVDSLLARRTYLKYAMRYRHHALYAQEARYHLAMAKLAQAKNIRLPGFKVSKYVSQNRSRSRASEKSKALADDKRKAADNAKTKWLKAKKKAAGESTATPAG